MSDRQLSEADRRVLQRDLEIVSSSPNVDGHAMLRSRDTTPTERSCNDQEGTIGYRAGDSSGEGSCSQAIMFLGELQ